MSRKANPTLIGAFVLGALVLVIGGIIVFGSGNLFSTAHRYVLFFDGGVSGLRTGAPVAFRGVRIGEVADIRMYYDPDQLKVWIPVVIQIDPGKIRGNFPSSSRIDESVRELVDRGLRAQLQLQSLVTGQLYVEFDFHPDRPVRLIKTDLPRVSETEKELMELPTIPSNLQEIEQKLQKLPLDTMASQALRTLEGIEELLAAERTRQAMDNLGETLENANALVTALRDRLPPLADELAGAAREGRTLIGNADAAVERLDGQAETLHRELKAAVANIQRLTETAGGTVERLDGDVAAIAETLQSAARSADRAMVQAEATLRAAEGITSKDTPLGYQLYLTLEDLSDAARAFRNLSETLSRNPEVLLRGKGRN
ncbi:MAG: MlaD family protein [Desulfococcaceae bacterium]